MKNTMEKPFGLTRYKLPKHRMWPIKELKENGMLYLFLLPGFVLMIIFAYLPMVGLIIVFKNYNFRQGIFGSPWVGFKNFEFFFYSFDKAARATFNTLILNACFIAFGLVFAIITAIVLNEIRSRFFKKITQALIFIPYFISWTVLGAILYGILSTSGTVNSFLKLLGMGSIDWYAQPAWWRPILTLVYIWKSVGYNSIIYLAVLVGMDPSLTEAATVDGASRLQRIWHIQLPTLRPTAVILILMSIGRIFYGDLTMVVGLTYLNPLLLPTTDLIDVFVYRSVMSMNNFSYTSAIGLYQSLSGFILVVLANYIVGKLEPENKLF